MRLEDPHLGVGDDVGAERPEEVGIFVDQFQGGDGGLVDESPAGRRARGQQQRLPPLAVLGLEVFVEEEGGEGVRLAVVAQEPRGARRRPEGDREVGGELAVNPLRLHRLDDVDGVQHFRRLDLALLVEITLVDANEVDPALRQGAGLAAELRRVPAGRPVDRPEADRRAGLEVNESASLDSDVTAVARLFLVEETKVDSAPRRESVGLGSEGEPAAANRLGRGGLGVKQSRRPRRDENHRDGDQPSAKRRRTFRDRNTHAGGLPRDRHNRPSPIPANKMRTNQTNEAQQVPGVFFLFSLQRRSDSVIESLLFHQHSSKNVRATPAPNEPGVPQRYYSEDFTQYFLHNATAPIKTLYHSDETTDEGLPPKRYHRVQRPARPGKMEIF